MTSKQIRGIPLGRGGDKVVMILLREIAATLAEFNERAKALEPMASDVVKMTAKHLSKVMAEIERDLQ